jgi:hypothetical protein
MKFLTELFEVICALIGFIFFFPALFFFIYIMVQDLPSALLEAPLLISTLLVSVGFLYWFVLIKPMRAMYRLWRQR